MNNKIYENIYNELSKPDSILKHHDTIKAHFTQKYQEYIPMVKTFRDIGDPFNIELMEAENDQLIMNQLASTFSSVQSNMGQMVNLESASNEIFIQKARNKGEGSFLVFVEGLSMYPLFKPDSRVPVKIMRTDAEYKVGDIVLFERSGVFVVHEVYGKYTESDGTIKYQTRGLNHETNPRVDRGELTGEQIYGIADLSEDFLAAIPALESQGLLFHMRAYGMINQFDALLGRAQEVHKKLTKINKNNKEAMLEVILEYMQVLIELRQIGFQSEKTRKFGNDLRGCINEIKENIFSGYTSELFQKMIGKFLGNILDIRDPRGIKADVKHAFKEINLLVQVILCADKFYDNKKMSDYLDRKNILTDISHEERGLRIDNLINNIFGKESENYKVNFYRELLNRVIDEQIKYYFHKYASDKELKRATCGGVVLKEGLDTSTYNPNEIYLNFGEHYWDGNKGTGYGIVHIIANHWEDFERMDPYLNTPERIAQFIFKIIETQTGVVMKEVDNGILLVYAFTFKNEDKVHYLELLIDDGTNINKPLGRLHTAYPVDNFYNDYMDDYISYERFFIKYKYLIGEVGRLR